MLHHSKFIALIRLVSFNILHKCNSISFTNCVSFTIVPYTMCHLLSFSVLSSSKCFIPTCYFKNISIIHFHSTYYHSQSSSFNILIQECFNHSMAHLSFNLSFNITIQLSLIIQYCIIQNTTYHSIVIQSPYLLHHLVQPVSFNKCLVCVCHSKMFFCGNTVYCPLDYCVPLLTPSCFFF